MPRRRSFRLRAARAWLPVAGLGLVICACSGSPAPAPATPETGGAEANAPTPASATAANERLVLPTAPDVVAEAMVALNADKFDCKPMESEKGVGACDVEKEGVPSIVLVYGSPVLFMLSHFLRKPDVTCAPLLTKLNEINGRVDRLKVVCIENRVTFMTALYVPTKGLTDGDLQETATWFRQSVQMVLATSGLVDDLQ